MRDSSTFNIVQLYRDSYTSKSEILNLLKQINRQGKTIIVVTHDPHVVKECSKVIKIEDGELVD